MRSSLRTAAEFFPEPLIELYLVAIRFSLILISLRIFLFAAQPIGMGCFLISERLSNGKACLACASTQMMRWLWLPWPLEVSHEKAHCSGS